MSLVALAHLLPMLWLFITLWLETMLWRLVLWLSRQLQLRNCGSS